MNIFIGAINRNNPPRGGEEYKNQLIVNKFYDSSDWLVIDTFQWARRPSTWFKLVASIFFLRANNILISASSVSTYRLLKIIQKVKPKLLPVISYSVIGGYFPIGVKELRFNADIYKKLKNIIVEGMGLKEALQNTTSFNNVSVIPNFKDFEIVNRIFSHVDQSFQFVFLGRINESKGIKEILIAAEILKSQNLKFKIDFYGPIEDDIELETDYCNFKGFLDFQSDSIRSYEILSEYNCLLFPTYWKGEGFPGVVIDAFIAGLPVIASDWNLNAEIIECGINGFLIEPKNANALAESMIWVMENRDQLEKIRQNNLEKAKDYHIDVVWPKLMDCVLQ